MVNILHHTEGQVVNILHHTEGQVVNILHHTEGQVVKICKDSVVNRYTIHRDKWLSLIHI